MKLSWIRIGLACAALASCAESTDENGGTTTSTTASQGGGGSGGDGGSTDGGGGSGASGGSGGATGGSGGTGGAGGAGGDGGAGGGCQQITNDASGIGADCMTTAMCLPGYTCQEYVGFVLDLSCQILCTQTCECPTGLDCIIMQDKVKTWMQCAQL
jgi:hypothetical protein